MKVLLQLKSEFKSAAGKDWKPGMTFDTPAPAAATAQPSSSGDAAALNDKITAQGNKVRDLKTAKADKVTIAVANVEVTPSYPVCDMFDI